jgi:hypothetical protein
MAGHMRLNGEGILRIGKGAENVHQLALRSQRSYPAVKEYTEQQDKSRIDLDVLASILIDGQGLSPDEMMNLRLSDVFNFFPET